MVTNMAAVILSAGKGTRMKSALPKVMHEMAGKPLLGHVLDLASSMSVDHRFIVLGHEREMIERYVGDRAQVVLQEEPLGSGHAVMQAAPFLRDEENVLVLSGDQPLLRKETLEAMIKRHLESGSCATVLTAQFENPFGYGRIIKNDGEFAKIVEEKDASPAEKAVKEINTGTYCFQAGALKKALKQLEPKNAQGEYYLTDVFQVLLADGYKIQTFHAPDWREALGINNRVQLAEVEGIYYEQIRRYWQLAGVTLKAPETIFIDADVTLTQDVTILPYSILKGKTIVEEGAVIGPRTLIENSVCKKRSVVESSTVRNAQIGEDCTVGPYAYLRPGAILENHVKVGDFTEVKNSLISEGSKVPHLSYIGDATVGRNVNIGAGTITCNYDGKEKHRTVVEDGAFIGSNTNFIAPVHIGASAVVGAGSTITGDVPEGALGVERAQQKNITNWRRS